ncbi:glycoside hydrolase family 35 protein [Rickenella mellea]|uniref:beta-galactosidase n=1 Tax=Rickenella mellea TaxID=50990 RepID=A0A4Y7PWI5_9AGAM|nr:glycoside hydrolase family 35 protein [Rickenella mellea]
MKLSATFLLLLAGLLRPALTQIIPPGSPGFVHGKSSAAVTFDNSSLLIDNNRVMLFSGEFHFWRIPSPQLWSDVLQKMKAAGFNGVSVYVHWGMTEGKQGHLDWNFHRSVTAFLQVAKRVGILVVMRPGPYINAETTGGGFPGWLSNIQGLARSNAQDYTNAWQSYMTQVAQAIAPFQYPAGPVIGVQVENEFTTGTNFAPYMVTLESVLRNNGINKVPLTYNDFNAAGRYASGQGVVDLWGFDSYPNGFTCSSPQFAGVSTGYAGNRNQYVPNGPLYFPEFQGGSFDPYGGSGYDACYTLTNNEFANVFYKNNYANHATLQSLYMTFGGTNWGNLATTNVYTSYDYGAPIREDRTLSTKYTEIKLQANFLHATQAYLTANIMGSSSDGQTYATNNQVWTTNLRNSDQTNFYVARQTSATNLNPVTFSLRVSTTAGALTIPQFGGTITLAGRESKIIVTNYVFGQSKLRYSTAEVMTWTTIDNTDIIVLYALAGQNTETVIETSATSVQLTQGNGAISSRVTGGTVVLTGNPNGVSVAQFGRTKVFIMDKATAGTFWSPRQSPTTFDLTNRQPATLIGGPYLVRNATIAGSTLNVVGDISSSGTLSVVAPAAVNTVTFNGAKLTGTKNAAGVWSGALTKPAIAATIPSLKTATWRCSDSLPEVANSFDDSKWVTATKTTTLREQKPTAGKLVLFGDEYGFHQGNLIYRGHFTGHATGVTLTMQGGAFFGYSAFLNGKFLGSSTGSSSDQATNTWNFPATNTGDNVLTIVNDNMGLDEDFSPTDSYKNPRGVRGYQLLGGGDFSSWKIQGNLGGESWVDEVRGPLNEGGLWFERVGAHLPGYDDSKWTANCSPLTGITAAGIRAYRTTFNLNIPATADVPISVHFTRTPSSNYRSVLYVNGWQFGRFVSNLGPQTVYPIPEGILNHRGSNTLVVTIWSLDAAGAKIAALDIAASVMISSTKEVVATVNSPGFAQLR